MTQFDLRQALRNLDIEVKPFGYHPLKMDMDELYPKDEILRGYSHDRWLAVNPEERWPVMVTFHEMAHILRGDTVLHKKFGIDFNHLPKRPTPEALRFIEYKQKNHDIIEAECHATGIIACQLTNTPFDMRNELLNLSEYTLGRDIPKHVMRAAHKTAKKIWAAGKVDERSLGWQMAAA